MSTMFQLRRRGGPGADGWLKERDVKDRDVLKAEGCERDHPQEVFTRDEVRELVMRGYVRGWLYEAPAGEGRTDAGKVEAADDVLDLWDRLRPSERASEHNFLRTSRQVEDKP